MRSESTSAVEAPSGLTGLLRDAVAGDAKAREKAMEEVYAALRSQAQHLMRQERSDHTLSATALVHETYLRLFGKPAGERSNAWESREQFMGYARLCMAHLLVDHARRKRSQRRGGQWRRDEDGADQAPLHESIADDDENRIESLASLDQALATLHRVNPRAARVLELRCLAGLDVEQTAELLQVSPRTVCRDWDLARALLGQMLDATRPGRDGDADRRS